MSDKNKVYEIINELGFDPQEGKCIVVKYTPKNMSAKIISFFSTEYYALQICENSLVLLPFMEMVPFTPKKEISLQIPFGEIKSISVREDGLNYLIDITTADSQIALSAQQKELASLRSSGLLTGDWMGDNWHSKNLDGVLEDLKSMTF